MKPIHAILIGIGLAAASGLAIFVPIMAFLFVLEIFYFVYKKVFIKFFRKPANELS